MIILKILLGIYLVIAGILFILFLYADYGCHDASLSTNSPKWAEYIVAITIDFVLAVIWPVGIPYYIKDVLGE